MNRERAKELLPIIQAYADGEVIECNDADADASPDWGALGDDVSFFNHIEYRVKPKPREFKIMVMDDGYVYDTIRQREGFAGELIKVIEVLE